MRAQLVDTVDNYGWTALMWAFHSGHHECARALVDADAAVDRVNLNALMVACESPPSHCPQRVHQGRIRCALALLGATVPIQEADFPDLAASLKLAGERIQQIEVALAFDARHRGRAAACTRESPQD
jgi:ankyrin repeat protein